MTDLELDDPSLNPDGSSKASSSFGFPSVVSFGDRDELADKEAEREAKRDKQKKKGGGFQSFGTPCHCQLCSPARVAHRALRDRSFSAGLQGRDEARVQGADAHPAQVDPEAAGRQGRGGHGSHGLGQDGRVRDSDAGKAARALHKGQPIWIDLRTLRYQRQFVWLCCARGATLCTRVASPTALILADGRACGGAVADARAGDADAQGGALDGQVHGPAHVPAGRRLLHGLAVRGPQQQPGRVRTLSMPAVACAVCCVCCACCLCNVPCCGRACLLCCPRASLFQMPLLKVRFCCRRIIATPGRLMHHLIEVGFSLKSVVFCCFDEADR